jgi:Effector-associated domain 10/NACHT domain
MQMSDNQNLNAIFDRIANRNATDGDIETLRQSIFTSVAIGGNVQDVTIMTGDDNIIGNRNTVQIGKYNINISEGSDIKIGDTTYQGANSETIRTIFLEVLANKVVIDDTFSRLFSKSESSEVDWDWGMKLLKQKQLPEIRKRLTDTLGRDRILMDVSIEEQQNWVNRSPLATDRTLQINGKHCGTLDANKMLIETFGRDDIEGKLLILGAPGAGKTTALLSLAEQLVYGAISQPKTVIPVIFELSTWQNDSQSIQSWLIEQLYDLHGGNRKSKLYEQWLKRQVLLPLLDGLDELGLERQKKCTEKLNEFAEHYPQLVVCCRIKEFETVDIKLRNLRGAVCLQSLSDSQIQDYLGSLKRPEMWAAIQTTPSLKSMLEPTTEGDPGLLRVPLFVKLVADVYDPQQPISGKTDLLDKYIDQQLSFDKREIDRRKELDEYKWAYKTVKLEPDWNKTRNILNWIARNLQTDNKVEFLIEHTQPSLIESNRLRHRYRFIYGLIYGLIFGLIYGLIFGLVFGPINGLIFGLICWLIAGLICGLVSGLANIETVEAFEISISNALKQEISREFKSGLFNGLKYSVIYGLINGLIFQPIYGLINWLSSSLTYGLISGLISGLKQELKLRLHPNQGIWNSLQSQMWITAIIFCLMIFPSIIYFRSIQGENSGLSPALFGLFPALFFGFSEGGGRVSWQHLSLRIVLWQSGLPWNFARFLNYCGERRLLLRVGGSYRFLHRELLDHFAQSNH